MLANAKLLKAARIALGERLEAIAIAADLHARTVQKIEAAEVRQSRGAIALQSALESRGIEFLKAPNGSVVGFHLPLNMDAPDQGFRKGLLPTAALIKAVRLALGLSLEEVATQAKIHPRTVGRVEAQGRHAEATAASIAVHEALEELGVEFLSASDMRGPGFRMRD